MNILCADFILTCNENFDIFQNGAICFDEKIIEVGQKEQILEKYKNAKVTSLPKKSVLMPGLINIHTHLEFSTNIATLTYGSFIPWLNSVIQNREDLSGKFSEDKIETILDSLLKNGTTTLGNISSFGIDLFVCKNAKQKIVYFVEAIGSAPDAIDALYSDFKARADEALNQKDERFIPALSVHSPYSTHKVLAKKVVEFAKKESLLVSAHFMESKAERDWLDTKSGEFKSGFFDRFNPNAKPFYENGLDFLETFDGVKTLFTHANFANEDEFLSIKKMGASISHCPTSNRLLGSSKFDLQNAQKKGILLTLGTDGLSSNTSLNLWSELKNALFVHADENLENLAKYLLLMATNFAAKSLNLKTGQLIKGYQSDIISFCLKELPKDTSNLCTQIILQTNKVDSVYINGGEVL